MAAGTRRILELKKIDANVYQSVHPLMKNGNTRPIAYGGFALAQAINAGCQNVDPALRIYSCFATYLGPTQITSPVTYTVEDIRTTRSFATRQIIATQVQNGQTRRTLIMLVDFHAVEAALFDYNVSPRIKYTDPEHVPDYQAHLKERVEKGELEPKKVEAFTKIFPILFSLEDYESRYAPEGVGFQNMQGLDKETKTTQDHLSITEKTSALWHRSQTELKTQGERAGMIAFVTDGALAFLPLMFDHKFVTDASAVSSLDVSLRFHQPEWDASEWLLSEQYCEAAAVGRTFATFRTFDKQGRLVATMSQQGILRPLPAKM